MIISFVVAGVIISTQPDVEQHSLKMRGERLHCHGPRPSPRAGPHMPP